MGLTEDITGYLKNEAKLFLDGIVDTVKFGYYSAKGDNYKAVEMAKRGVLHTHDISYTLGEGVSAPVSVPLIKYAKIKEDMI